jgi:hemerythrin
MSYWSWDSSLSVGIEFIDAKHRRFIDYINTLDEGWLPDPSNSRPPGV